LACHFACRYTGEVKIALGQINPTVGDFQENANKMVDFAHQAQGAGAGLDIEPNPDNDQVTFNVALGNGSNPSPLINPVFAVDLAWDTTGTGNCWKHNKAQTQFPSSLPSCGG